MEDHNPENAKPYGEVSEDANQKSSEMLGLAGGAAKYGGSAKPVGESNESGIYTKPSAAPGFKN